MKKEKISTIRENLREEFTDFTTVRNKKLKELEALGKVKLEKGKIIESIVDEACWSVKNIFYESQYLGEPEREVSEDEAKKMEKIIKETTEKLCKLF